MHKVLISSSNMQPTAPGDTLTRPLAMICRLRDWMMGSCTCDAPPSGGGCSTPQAHDHQKSGNWLQRGTTYKLEDHHLQHMYPKVLHALHGFGSCIPSSCRLPLLCRAVDCSHGHACLARCPGCPATLLPYPNSSCASDCAHHCPCAAPRHWHSRCCCCCPI